MIIKAYIYHKRAEKYSDCQDCFGIDFQNNRIAVSDGMSQSIFPQWWAKILVEYYLKYGHIPEDILPLQERWQQMLHDEIHKREEEAKTNPKRNPWRLKNSLAEKFGAGATLCGLTLGDNEWKCSCIGDSCLIAVNHDYNLNFYTSQVGEFSNQPDYLDSFGDGRGKPICKSINRDVKALLLVTDPFSELFQLHENNPDFIKSRFKELTELSDHNSFVELVEKWRDNFGMHNDDSTLVLIQDLDHLDFSKGNIDNLDLLCAQENTSEEKQTKTPLLPTNVTIENSSCTNPIETTEREDAEKRLVSACEAQLRNFYTGKKKKKPVEKYIINLLKKTIDNFTK